MVFGWGKKKSIEPTVEHKSVNQNITLSDGEELKSSSNSNVSEKEPLFLSPTTSL